MIVFTGQLLYYNLYFYCCPVNIDNSLSDGLLYSFRPLIELQQKEYRIFVFKRTRIFVFSKIKRQILPDSNNKNSIADCLNISQIWALRLKISICIRLKNVVSLHCRKGGCTMRGITSFLSA